MKVEKSDLQLETIVSRIWAGELDLQPDFQRGEVWDTKRQQRLIDTILRDWYVPAVHIVVNDDGDEEVLDGQQRLATIRNFFENRLRVDGRIEPADAAIEALHGKTYSKLPGQTKKAVNRFVLSIVRLIDYEPQEPNELFFRLNQSYTLTPPEKRNALHGKARDQVKGLVSRLTNEGLLDRSTVGFANSRLAYDDILARTCVAIENRDLRLHINNNVVEEFYRSSEFANTTVDGACRAGELLKSLIAHTPNGAKFNKGTLQTWLLYCHWAPLATGPIPADLLVRFEEDRLRLRSGESLVGGGSRSQVLTEILRIYDDRAAYRVTDVSSVLIRDLSVHLYSVTAFGTPGVRGSGEVAAELLSGRSTAAVIGDFITRSDWGQLPWGAVSA